MSEFLGRQVDFQNPAVTNLNNTNLSDGLSPSKLLTTLYDISIPDPSDENYKMEGRPQKTIVVKTSFGMLLGSNDKLTTKLDLITNLIARGAAANANGQQELAQLVREMIDVLGTRGVQAVANSSMADQFFEAVDTLNIPNKPELVGLPRYVDQQTFNDNKTRILEYIVANTNNLNLPINRGGVAVDITQLDNIGRGEMFDLLGLEFVDIDPRKGVHGIIYGEPDMDRGMAALGVPPPPPRPRMLEKDGPDRSFHTSRATQKEIKEKIQDFQDTYRVKLTRDQAVELVELDNLLLAVQGLDDEEAARLKGVYKTKVAAITKKAASSSAASSSRPQVDYMTELKEKLAKRGKGSKKGKGKK